MEFLVNHFKLMLPFAFLVFVFSQPMLKLVSLISVVDRLTGFYMDYSMGDLCLMGTLG